MNTYQRLIVKYFENCPNCSATEMEVKQSEHPAVTDDESATEKPLTQSTTPVIFIYSAPLVSYNLYSKKQDIKWTELLDFTSGIMGNIIHALDSGY